MSPSASFAETYPHVSYDGIAALLAALKEEQQARAASSGASTPALSPEFWEAYHAFQATLLVGDEDSSASSPSLTPAGSSGDAHGSPATPSSLNQDSAPAVPGAGAQYPTAVDAEQARPGTPPSMDNFQALRALLSVIGRGGAQSPRAFEYAHGRPAYPQQPGAQFPDASRPPAYAPDGLLAQPPLDAGAGALQGYFAPSPPGYYMGNGLPPLNHYGPPVPQDFQHGYYYNYIPEGSGGVDVGGGPLQYAAPGFPMPPQSEPNAHLGSAKPLSATGRPNELAGLAEGEVEGLSTKRKRPSPDWKGKKKAKEVEENVDDDERGDDDDDDDVASPPKKRRRAPRKGAAKPARKNRSYTRLPDGNYRCSRCGDDKIKNKGKHGQMCGKGPLCCPICGLELKSRRRDALKRHYKASRCRSAAAAAAAASCAGPTDDSSTAGIELAIACDDTEDGTHEEDDEDDEDDEDADEDVDGSWDDEDDEDDESDVYANVAGPSSVTLEDIASPTPDKKAKKGKAAKKN